MRQITILLTLIIVFGANLAIGTAQQHSSQPPTTSNTTASTPQQQITRDATREKLRQVLDAVGPKINVSFRQSDKQPYNFVGLMKTSLKNADTLEIVVSVSAEQTIHFRIFPHYNGGYLNIDKAKSGEGLMRQMVRFSDTNFLFWGADGSGDIFAGYNFTLESGFPEASVRVVLNSIAKADDFVGQMRPSIDGSTAP
ncbi:MAG: hypothetical protein QOH70_737 [Blastocatellia bacterium]|nr:hypothetical protein [Blastocatellia bacterium]